MFLKALEKLGSYQFSGVPFSAWLYRIAHNRLVDYLRAQPKKQGISLDECLSVDDPAAQPYMTGVGGTTLTVSAPGGPYVSEKAWIDGGGGVSS